MTTIQHLYSNMKVSHASEELSLVVRSNRLRELSGTEIDAVAGGSSAPCAQAAQKAAEAAAAAAAMARLLFEEMVKAGALQAALDAARWAAEEARICAIGLAQIAQTGAEEMAAWLREH